MSEREKNSIRTALEQTEPSEGAKERMLANILRKAEEQTEEPIETKNKAKTEVKETADVTANATPDDSQQEMSRRTMILSWALPAAAFLLVVICGAVMMHPDKNKPVNTIAAGGVTVTAGAEKQPGDGTITFHADAKAIYDRIGVALYVPDSMSNPRFSTIGNNIGEALFEFGECQYMVRAARRNDDFSGVYGTDESATVLDDGANMITLKSGNQTYYKFFWQQGDVNYILVNLGTTDREAAIAIYQCVAQ
ncbi:MAG: hypothetical protein J5795_04325 [Lachnospiraceae bacterium]|nr:hypothetical protein [Lachnospiraceae bacterium]